MPSLGIDVTLKGPLFDKPIEQKVKAIIIGETLHKIEERVQRPGAWQQRRGARRNRVGSRQEGLLLNIDSTLNNPRNTGAAWTRKNMGIIRGMAPRVLKATAQRITAEFS